MITNFLTSRRFWITVVLLMILSAILATVDRGIFFRGWIAILLLLFLGLLVIIWVRNIVSASGKIFNLAISAALLRLLIGVGLIVLLPIYGYKNSEEHQSGYIFHDSYVRDQQAWELAESDSAIGIAFSGAYSGDQYGGSLALFAGIYRYLSPDAHRQTLPLVVNAVASALGVLLLWAAVKIWFGEKVAWLSGLIFAFYPEAVLLGSSQMREQIVMTGVAMSFYSLSIMRTKSYTWLGWLIASSIILYTFQAPVALYSFIILFGVWFFNPDKKRSWILLGVFSAILVLGLIIVVAVWANLPSLQQAGPLDIFITWLQNNFQFQSYVTERASGMIQKLFDTVGESWAWLVITVYGIAQPVLPAVFGDPDAAWIIRVITFLRAAGWYTLIPLLIYAVFASIRAKDEPRRTQIIWANVVIWIWIFIAALSAGGDQWDNPRYRTTLLAWQALAAAWAWWWAREKHDPWLRRIVSVEVIFILLFTMWYIGRYYLSFLHLDIWIMIGITFALAFIVLVGGYARDRSRRIGKKP